MVVERVCLAATIRPIVECTLENLVPGGNVDVHRAAEIAFARRICGLGCSSWVYRQIVERMVEDELDGRFYRGTVGTGWLLSYLNQGVELTCVEDFLAALDEALLEALDEIDGDFVVGIWNGAAGWLWYALQRANRRLIDALVLLLDRVAISDKHGRTWLEPKANFGLVVETGLAHGISAVISGLAHISGNSVARTLLEDVTRWLIARIRPAGTSCLSWFEFPHDRDRMIKTDAGWAHGDAGIALAIYGAATALEKPQWRKIAIEVGLRSLARPRADYIQRPCISISHGAAGLTHIYQQLYFATGYEEFLAGARTWARECLVAYECASPDVPHIQGLANSFVGGHLGVAAVLTAATQIVPPNWAGYLATSSRS